MIISINSQSKATSKYIKLHFLKGRATQSTEHEQRDLLRIDVISFYIGSFSYVPFMIVSFH